VQVYRTYPIRRAKDTAFECLVSTVKGSEIKMKQILAIEPSKNKFMLSLGGRIQYFNGLGGEGGEGGFDGPPVPSIDNPLLAGNEPAAPTNPEPTPQPIEKLNFGGREIDPTDPNALNVVHQDYSNLNRTYTQTSQELAQARQMLDHYQTLVQTQQQVQQPVQPAQPQFTQEDRQAFSEKYQELLYEDPIEAELYKLNSPVYQHFTKDAYGNNFVKPHIEPIQQYTQEQQTAQQWSTVVQSVQSKYPDLEQYNDQIIQAYQDNPRLTPDELENVYFQVKGRAQASFTPESLLQDPNFVQQHILSNEQIRNQVLSQYAQNKQQNQPPVVMGTNVGGQMQTLGEVKPKSIKEAGQMWQQWQSRQQ
jgi:hypothetical protein